MKKKLNIRAVVIGTVVDLGVSVILGFITGIAAALCYAGADNKAEASGPAIASSLSIQVITLVGGLLCVTLGAYIAARIAEDEPVFNAVMVGIVGILIGLLLMDSKLLWFNVASFLLIVPAAYAGGILGRRSKGSNAERTT